MPEAGSQTRVGRGLAALTAAPVVVKIGGSTLGARDTTLEDVAALRRQGTAVAIIHGGGAEISRWLDVHAVPSHFVDGLRVTDAAAIDVVVAVLAGLINKQLVAQLDRLGVRSLGVCGPDGGILRGEIENPALGLVGTVTEVGVDTLALLFDAGIVPVIAPIAVERGTARLLNVNGDTAAGVVAAAFAGSRLVFLTDVAGVLDADGRLIARLDAGASERLRRDGVLKGGMIPKIDACFAAARGGATPRIVDGRQPGALVAALGPSAGGTTVSL